jgi:hypothetical protein
LGIKMGLLWAMSYGEVVLDLESDFRFLMVALSDDSSSAC